LIPGGLTEGATMRLWSEIRGGRAREQIADAATAAWLVLWAGIAWGVYQLVAGFADAGRTIRDGGQTMIQGGRDLGAALAGVPLVGEGLRDVAQDAFAGAGSPIVSFGTDLEGLIVLVGALLGLLILLVPTLPWLTRYLPWRWSRLRSMRAGHHVIREAPSATPAAVQEVLALRAVTRLDYRELLEFTPDPIGDWVAGRHDRLARAELASVGLRP
jgi:hypothetical protein